MKKLTQTRITRINALRRAVVSLQPYMSPRKMSQTLHVGTGFIRYWQAKAKNPNFKNASHGGLRHSKFYNELDRLEIENFLLLSIKNQPSITTIMELVNKCQDKHGVTISKFWISSFFNRYKFSFKTPSLRKIEKYSSYNMARHKLFTSLLPLLPLSERVKLKYLDESSFCPRGMLIILV
jgi:transposase